MIELIVSPPRPITTLILSGWIEIISILGAYGLNSLRGSAIVDVNSSRISKRAFFACVRASRKICSVIP